MSTITADPRRVRRAPSGIPARVRQSIRDSLLVARRNVVTLTRVPAVFIFELVQPIMFVLLFVFIYANQLATLPPGLDYVQFLMPGIFIQNALFGSTNTAIGLAEDFKTGVIDRFRSLPMARSAVVAGRTTSDVIKNGLLLTIVIGVGYLVGFRFHERVPQRDRHVRARHGRGVHVLVDLGLHRVVAEAGRGRAGGLLHVDLPGGVRELGVRARSPAWRSSSSRSPRRTPSPSGATWRDTSRTVVPGILDFDTGSPSIRSKRSSSSPCCGSLVC